LRPVQELLAAARAAAPPAGAGRNGEGGEPRSFELLDLRALGPTLRLDVRYATANNFLGTPVYPAAVAKLQVPAAHALERVRTKLAAQGLGLLVYDAYRPWYVTKVFFDATPPAMRHFVADPAHGSRHNRGCAVDLTLYDLSTGEVVEMPSGYDEFTPRAYPDYPGGTSRQRHFRELLRRAMEDEGFAVYEYEWWHFDYHAWREFGIGNEPL
jgi:D-alanyl-D-alanine dipeptidase